ncbi:MAG: hypothetical protein GWN87_14190 [Desulfuromonadales bacterium]|nr:hypothetical protein [Desulfuromonadales bacterium]NIS41477.1 hypothetical protein [Desulfuromonadales bacterium]
MSSRGAVELVVLSVAVQAGIIGAEARAGEGPHIYSCLVVMAVVTTLVAPPLLRATLKPRSDDTGTGSDQASKS